MIHRICLLNLWSWATKCMETILEDINRKKKSVILPQYLISHRLINSSRGANFSSRTICLSLQCKMLVVLLSLMWNSSHLNATVNKYYGLEAFDQSFQVVTQQFNDRLTNYEFGKLRRKRTGGSQNRKCLVSTIVMVRLEPGNSERRIRGNYETGNEDKLRLKFAVACYRLF